MATPALEPYVVPAAVDIGAQFDQLVLGPGRSVPDKIEATFAGKRRVGETGDRITQHMFAWREAESEFGEQVAMGLRRESAPLQRRTFPSRRAWYPRPKIIPQVARRSYILSVTIPSASILGRAALTSDGIERRIGGPCHPTVEDDGSGDPAPVAGSPSRSHRFGSS